MPFLAEASITIPVSPEVAFDKLVDFPTWDDWMPRSFRPARSARRLHVGDRVFVRIAGSPFASPITVSTIDRPKTIAWRGGAGKMLFAEHAFHFEASEGGTVVRSQELWDGRIAPALRPVVQRLATRIGRETLEAFARSFGGRARPE